MTLARLLPWKRMKTADTDMQTIQTDPALAEMEAVAAKFREDRNHWRARAIDAEAKLARLKASRERSNANLAAANAKRRANARTAQASIGPA